MIHKYLTSFCLAKVNFILNILDLSFARMNLISIFAAPQGG